MAILEIVKHPSAILTAPCKDVTVFDEELGKLLDDMYETMVENDGVGIAAPQVGRSIRAAIVDFDEEQDIIEMINPVVTHTAGSDVDVEGCLSFPGLFGEVERPFRVRIEAQERDGSLYELEAEGFEARAIQHEIDHLNGVLFDKKILRIVDPSEFEEEDDE